MLHKTPTANPIAVIFNHLFQTKAKGIKLEELTKDDAIVVVLGPTGSGKSSFIELATGITGLVGHGLESCTSEISVVKLPFPGLDLCFVDTPGFDDTNKSDVEILKMISDWLSSTYKRQIRLTGLLYFHRISDNRMAGTPLKNFHLFEKLCGDDFNRIVLTTTMWAEVDEEIGAERERELNTVYWKSMVDRGSYVKRFLYTRESAFEILRPIFDEVHERSALLLQREMNDLGLLLKETSAGKVLSLELEDLVLRHQGILEKMRNDLKDPTITYEQLQYLMDEYQKVSTQLQRASEDLHAMKVSTGDRIRKLVTIVNWTKIFSCSGISLWKKNRPTSKKAKEGENSKTMDEEEESDSVNEKESWNWESKECRRAETDSSYERPDPRESYAGSSNRGFEFKTPEVGEGGEQNLQVQPGFGGIALSEDRRDSKSHCGCC